MVNAGSAACSRLGFCGVTPRSICRAIGIGVGDIVGTTPPPPVAKWMVPPAASIRDRFWSLAMRIDKLTSDAASCSSAIASLARAWASARLRFGSRPFISTACFAACRAASRATPTASSCVSTKVCVLLNVCTNWGSAAAASNAACTSTPLGSTPSWANTIRASAAAV